MKKLVKVTALVMALLMVSASFAGCSNSTKKDSDKKDASKTYIIYSDNAFAPFEYLDEKTNKYVGLDMDLLDAVAKDQNFKYEVHNEGFDASMGAVQSGQADAMIAGMTITDERKETYDFSNGYFDDGQILVVGKDSKVTDIKDIKGKTVAVKTSTMGSEYAESVKEKYGFTLNYYEGSAEMYQAVQTGTDAACFEDFSVIGWAIESGNVDLKTVGKVVNSKPYGFAVKKGSNAELIKLFNKGLKSIKENGKYDDILEKYGY